MLPRILLQMKCRHKIMFESIKTEGWSIPREPGNLFHCRSHIAGSHMARDWPKTQKKTTNIYQKISDEKAYKMQRGMWDG